MNLSIYVTERKKIVFFDMLRLGIYRHYKGGMYLVIAIARHTKTLKPMVVYHGLSEDYRTWVRPLNVFTEKVLFNHEPVERFKLIKGNPREDPPDYR